MILTLQADEHDHAGLPFASEKAGFSGSSILHSSPTTALRERGQPPYVPALLVVIRAISVE